MIFNTGVSLNLWDEVMLTTYYVLNHVPHKKSKIIPFELWKGFKVCGYLAYLMLADPKRSKFGVRVATCIFFWIYF